MFFDFTWQEMTAYDVPAFINFVLEKTKYEKLTWIGHSQGSTQMFYGLSDQSPINLRDKVNLMIALAPVTQIKHINVKLF